ncbi:MAG TPA: Fe-S protein assembly co-chaperone HscB [Burkholderiales bacterium]|jgi:molecular chaperone HscB|nr:Fe-S protein assembly co-chaperone HscB [Burkholderiales bacterium]
MTSDFSKSYFELFKLPVSYKIDTARLEVAYREVQSRVHPDRFVSAPEAERRRSMQWATHANEAYTTLKKPLARARYLLKLHGVDTAEETNTAMPVDFLMEQMEWREAIVEAKQDFDSDALQALTQKLSSERGALLAALEMTIDVEHDYQTAAGAVRKLRFLEKLQDEIEFAVESIEEMKGD